MVTASRLEKTLGDSWTHLDIHNCSFIMAIASKEIHQSKQNWGSGVHMIHTYVELF